MSAKERVERRLESTLTVKELIEQLQHYAPDMPVFFAQDARDYWHSVLASGVEGVEEETVYWSDYHTSLKVPGDKGIEEGAETVDVVLLR